MTIATDRLTRFAWVEPLESRRLLSTNHLAYEFIGVHGRLSGTPATQPFDSESTGPAGHWRFEYTFGPYSRWHKSDGSGWGGDPMNFSHREDSINVSVKGTWHGDPNPGSGWFLDTAKLYRRTPAVTISARDTAVEGTSDYAAGQEPGFVVRRSGDERLSALVVSTEDLGGTADVGTDYAALPTSVTIAAGSSEAFVPLRLLDGVAREWTESVKYAVTDGDYYTLGQYTSTAGRIQDNDGADVHADDLPEEYEDADYNETDPGLLLSVNDDDDDGDGVPDGEQSSLSLGDDDLKEVRLRFPSDEKYDDRDGDGQADADEPRATVTLQLDNRLFRVWHDGQVLLGGPDGPTSVDLDYEADGPEMTVQVEAVPPPPELEATAPGVPINGNLTLTARDVGLRASTTVDALHLQGAIKPGVCEISYSATDPDRFYAVLGDEGGAYASPQWRDDDLDGTADVTNPVAYRREATMVVSASFSWAGVSDLGNNLVVKGDGPASYDFYARLGVDDPNDERDLITVQGDRLTMTDSASAAFPNWIDHFDTFDIDWSVSADGGATWVQAGTSKNQVYTVLEEPTTTLFHTAVHIATAPPAKGLHDPAAVVNAIWQEFADNEVRRVTDDMLLNYSHHADGYSFTAQGMLAREDGRVRRKGTS